MNQVLKWVLSGATEQDIREAIEHHWKGQDPRELFGSVFVGLQETSRFERDAVVGWCFEAYRDLYRRMVEAADYPGALRAVKLMGDLARENYVQKPEPGALDLDQPAAAAAIEGDRIREEEAGPGEAGYGIE